MSLIRNKAFLLLALGQGVSMFGTQVSQLALPLLVLDLTASPAITGLFVGLRNIPQIVLLLPAGALLDRWNRKRVMLVSDSARALALGSVPVALLVGGPALYLLALVALVEGVFNTFFTVAEQACLPHVVEPQELPHALAVDNTSDQLSRMAGPSLGGFLYVIGHGVPFAADAISYAASVVSLLFIKVPFQAERAVASTDGLLAQMRAGMAYLLRHPVLRLLVVLVGGLNFCSQGYPLIMIVRAQELGADAQTIGLLFASGGIGGIVGAIAAPRLQQRLGVGRMVMLASWIWVLTWPPFALAPDLRWLAVANALGWIIVPIHAIAQLSYRLQVIPDALLGRVNSVYRLIAFGGQPLALALTGVLLQSFGAVNTVWLITLPQLVIVIAVTRPLWSVQACSIRSMR